MLFCCFSGEYGCEVKTSRGLKYHIESVHKDVNVADEAKQQEKYFFSCTLGEKGFKFKTLCDKNQLTHATEAKVYYCPYGHGKHYVMKYNAEVKHGSKWDQNLSIQRYCLLCNSVFLREEELYEHLRTLHKRNGSHFCSKCQIAFPQRGF